MSDWTSDIYHPGYFIALDDSDRSIIVAVRGSSNVSDVMTDLVCEPYELDALPTIDRNSSTDDPDDSHMMGMRDGVVEYNSAGSSSSSTQRNTPQNNDVDIEDAYA